MRRKSDELLLTVIKWSGFILCFILCTVFVAWVCYGMLFTMGLVG